MNFSSILTAPFPYVILFKNSKEGSYFKMCKEEKKIQKRSIQTKNSIIQAGIKLFSEKGYYQTNSKEIAKLAGVSTGSFYTYFEDKKDLIVEIIKKYRVEMDETTIHCSEEECDEDFDHLDLPRFFINRILSVAKKYPLSFHKEIDIVLYREKDLHDFWKSYYENKIEIFAGHLKHFSHILKISDYKESARVVFGVSDQMIYEYLRAQSEDERQSITNAYVELLNKYLYK